MLSALTAENRKGTRHGGSPPREATHPEAGAGRHVAQYPARHGARQGSRITRMRRRRTRSGVGGRAGAVRGRRRARCTTEQRRRERTPSGGVRIGVPGVPGWPLRHSDPAGSCWVALTGYSLGTECPTLGYSGYSHGVSCAWNRMADSGWHREWQPIGTRRPQAEYSPGYSEYSHGSSENSHAGCSQGIR